MKYGEERPRSDRARPDASTPLVVSSDEYPDKPLCAMANAQGSTSQVHGRGLPRAPMSLCRLVRARERELRKPLIRVNLLSRQLCNDSKLSSNASDAMHSYTARRRSADGPNMR